MNRDPIVVGIVQERNQWPLIAVSISHVLLHHVNYVYVLEHRCSDESREGIERLRGLWKDRLKIFEYQDEEFFQEASTNAIIQVCQDSRPDWIYVFDADEFLFARDDESLPGVISKVDAVCDVIQYEVENWISLADFDDRSLERYRGLRYRSIPKRLRNMDELECENRISKGELTFFDIPFPSKVIFRNRPESWLSAGSHMLKNNVTGTTINPSADLLRAIHFPFLTEARLSGKALQGENYIKTGLPSSHGWQQQMLYRMSKQDLLHEFWQAHSIRSDSPAGIHASLSFVCDDQFVRSIEPTLSLLQANFGLFFDRNKSKNASRAPGEDTSVKLNHLVHVAHKFQAIADSARDDADALHRALADRDGKIHTLTDRLAKRDEAIDNLNGRLAQQYQELMATIRDRDSQISSLTSELSERHAQIDVLSSDLMTFKQSAVFQFLQNRRKAVDRLFPHGSLRRRAVRVLLSRGWRALFSGLIRKLRPR